MTRTQWVVLIAIAALLLSLCLVEVMRGEDPRTANREALALDLTHLALRAQDYYHRPVSTGGGQGTFIGLNADATGLSKLTSRPRNTNGTFAIVMAGDARSVALMGVGDQKGADGVCFIKLTMMVFADSMALTENN